MKNQENAITSERVKILYERAFSSINTALAASIIIAYILWGKVEASTLIPWLAFMFTIALVRFWLLFDYNRNKQDTLLHDKFEKRYSYATAMVGISWAFIIIIGLNLPEPEYRLYSSLLLVSIIAISVPIFSSSPKTLYFYIAPALITSLPLLLFRGGNDTAVGIALIVFTLMLLRTGKDSYKTLIDTLALRYQTQEQAEKLKQMHFELSSTNKRIQGIMDYAPVAIYVRDLDGYFTFLNKTVSDLYHMPHEEIVGKKLFDILPNNNIANEINNNDLEVIKTKEPTKFDESLPQDDGLHHYISTKFPLFDEVGELCAVGSVSTDITERIHIEESLRISQQRLLLYREQSPLGIIEWNTSFEVLYWNPAAQSIFGYTEEDVLGHSITEKIISESVKKKVDEVWNELMAKEGGVYSINENITKDGQTILCEWHNTPLIDQNGKIIGVTSLVEDITEREKNKENLHQTQKMDAIGKLTGGIAHDFNNMLGVILGFSKILKKKLNKDDSELIRYNEQVIFAGTRASKLTSKLLEFSRKAPSFYESTNLNQLINEMRDMLEKTLTPRINLSFELEENLWDVWLDKGRLEDCVLNLSINAMHAMSDGGELILKSKNIHNTNLNILPGDYVLLSVVDSGVGMSKDIQEKMFDPFFTTKGENGTGLGLSQVYGFVQQLGGHIEVFSTLGVGTQIDFYIPRYHEHETTTSNENYDDSLAIPSGDETILVVDDEVMLLELAELILTAYGYTVICSESGEEALELLKTHSVDMLLTDVIMPGMDGYQLAAVVQTSYPEIKIQIVSGFIEEEQDKDGDYVHENRLLKPYNAEVLLKKVRMLLDENK